MFGLEIGWRHYPIKYKESQYTVEIKVKPYYQKDFTVIGTIYRYTEKILFHKHRKQKIYQRNIDKIAISEDSILNIQAISEKEYLCYYPQIIRCLFELYEEDKHQKDSINEKIKVASNWNGIVK